MKANTLQAKIDSHLRTKSGAIAVKYQNVEKVLLGERYHGAGYSGSGRFASKTNGDHFSTIEGLRLIGVDFTTGNDAPRGGWSGQFVELSAKGKRQVAEWAKQRKAEITAEKKRIEDERAAINAQRVNGIKTALEILNGNREIVAEYISNPEIIGGANLPTNKFISNRYYFTKMASLAQRLGVKNDKNFRDALNRYFCGEDFKVYSEFNPWQRIF